MKRFVLFVFLLVFTLLGRAQQVVLNELYTDPNPSNNEFFELYNSSSSDLPLDCYSLVTMYQITINSGPNKGTYTGAYVLDFPSVTINSKSWVVGASAIPFSVQKQSNITKANFNWNNLVGTTGSLKKYQLNTKNSDSTSLVNANFVDVTNDPTFKIPAGSTTGTTDLKDFLPNINGALGGSVQYAFFLFNNGTYVNGFLGRGSSTAIPSILAKLKPLNYSISCSGSNNNIMLDWSSLKIAEYAGIASGSDNGYARKSDGACGTWVKAPSPSSGTGYTPLASNGSATGSTAGFFTTNETISCNNRLYFQIASSSDPSSLPATVQIYQDNAPIGTLDASDAVVYTSPQIAAASDNYYSFNLPDPTKQYLVVYYTKLGCIDKVAIPTTTSLGITTTQSIICGTQVGYTITGGKSDSTFATPIEVGLYAADPNNPNALPNDTSGKQVGKAIVSTLTTTNGTLYSASGVITLSTAGKDKPIIVVYKQNFTCAPLAPVRAFPVTGTLNTTQPYTCGQTITYTITPSTTETGSIYTYGLPLQVKIINDANFNGVADEDTTNGQNVLASQLVTSYTNGQASGVITLAPSDQGKQIWVAYQTPFACLNPTPTFPRFSGNVAVEGGIQCSSNPNNPTTASYFVNNLTTASDAYPITLKIYEDANQNGVIDPSEKTAIGTQTISTAPDPNSPNTVYFVTLNNPNSYTIITGVGAICSATTLISSSCGLLPVKFTSFSADRSKSNKSVVNLKWQTGSEQNNRGFNVQRLYNGVWKTIAFVFSQGANGNSSSTLSYEYRDANSERGLTQYRIQQVDLDDRASYSEVRSVMGLEQAASMIVFPNPSNTGKVTLLFNAPSVRDVIVSDVAGRVIQQYQNISGTTLEIAHLPAGMFVIRMMDHSSGTTAVEKVVIQPPY